MVYSSARKPIIAYSKKPFIYRYKEHNTDELMTKLLFSLLLKYMETRVQVLLIDDIAARRRRRQPCDNNISYNVYTLYRLSITTSTSFSSGAPPPRIYFPTFPHTARTFLSPSPENSIPQSPKTYAGKNARARSTSSGTLLLLLLRARQKRTSDPRLW